MVLTPSREAADIISEEGGKILKLCHQCSMCTSTFGEQCTPKVEESIPVIANMVIRKLDSA